MKWTVSILFVLLSTFTFANNGYPIIEKLVKQQKYSLAYELATKIRSQNEGDPRFDYLFGLAALQTGHYNEAVFALERVKFASPNVIRPRLELARAYLKLNNKTAALSEFKSVLQLSPPMAVKQNIESYITALGKEQSPLKIKSITKKPGFIHYWL